MMQLPHTDDVDVSNLSRVFNETTNAYKFYWFLAILDALQATDEPRLSVQDLSLRMVASVWYPLNYFKLSFGKQDGFKPIADVISEHIPVDTKPNGPSLLSQLRTRLGADELVGIYRRIGELLRWVPYRFIRPFFENETRRLADSQVNKLIINLASQNQKAPYYFEHDHIVIHKRWLAYFQQHQYVLRGFIHWHLVRFLQKNNPNVPAISEKLERPVDRDFRLAKPFWKAYLNECLLTCIYSNQPVTASNFSIDHYLPFSFVAHDQLWNLLPTTKTVNSAKNDQLPDTGLYFNKFARLQYDVYQFYAGKEQTRKLEEYSLLFRESTDVIRNQSPDWFRERLEQTVMPQLQTARNMGFFYPFIFRKT